MTTYTQYQLSNPTPSQLDAVKQLEQKYSFSMTFDQGYRILTITTKDSNLITLIDSKNVTGIVKTTVTISEYDDTKTITDVETAILANGDTSAFRPELINLYKSTLLKLQNQAQNLNIANWQTMTISQLQTAITQVLPNKVG